MRHRLRVLAQDEADLGAPVERDTCFGQLGRGWAVCATAALTKACAVVAAFPGALADTLDQASMRAAGGRAIRVWG